MKKDRFIIKGGKKLSGTIPVMGAKNAALKAFAASLLTDEKSTIRNVPLIEDIFRMSELLESLGVEVKKSDEREFQINPAGIKNHALQGDIAKKLRSSIVLSGPILAKFGKVSFPHPGGCVIGARPIDVFLEGYKKMGAEARPMGDGGYLLKAKKLKGADIFFRTASVTGTETLMMAATIAKGRTVLRNAACEPEIKSLADFLNKCGARIRGAGTNTICIDGVASLRGGTYLTPPDRIEAGSFAAMGALLGNKLRVTNCEPEHIASALEHLRIMGVKMTVGKNWIEITRPKRLLPIDIKTREYPGFPTDLQSPFAVILTQAGGVSSLFETVFEGRLGYLEDLSRMGANIVSSDTHKAVITGPSGLRGREMESPDLRAGLAFVLAALIAKGESVIHNVYNIDRGYERIEERLKKIGADIRRV